MHFALSLFSRSHCVQFWRQRMPNEKLRNDLSNIENWDEARIEVLLNNFVEDVKEGQLEDAGWPMMLPAYSVSKM